MWKHKKCLFVLILSMFAVSGIWGCGGSGVNSTSSSNTTLEQYALALLEVPFLITNGDVNPGQTVQCSGGGTMSNSNDGTTMTLTNCLVDIYTINGTYSTSSTGNKNLTITLNNLQVTSTLFTATVIISGTLNQTLNNDNSITGTGNETATASSDKVTLTTSLSSPNTTPGKNLFNGTAEALNGSSTLSNCTFTNFDFLSATCSAYATACNVNTSLCSK